MKYPDEAIISQNPPLDKDAIFALGNSVQIFTAFGSQIISLSDVADHYRSNTTTALPIRGQR